MAQPVLTYAIRSYNEGGFGEFGVLLNLKFNTKFTSRSRLRLTTLEYSWLLFTFVSKRAFYF